MSIAGTLTKTTGSRPSSSSTQDMANQLKRVHIKIGKGGITAFSHRRSDDYCIVFLCVIANICLSFPQ